MEKIILIAVTAFLEVYYW